MVDYVKINARKIPPIKKKGQQPFSKWTKSSNGKKWQVAWWKWRQHMGFIKHWWNAIDINWWVDELKINILDIISIRIEVIYNLQMFNYNQKPWFIIVKWKIILKNKKILCWWKLFQDNVLLRQNLWIFIKHKISSLNTLNLDHFVFFEEYPRGYN